MRRILVVEDDHDLLFLYRIALSQKSFEVIEAENAETARMELDNGTFDAMILDLNMPDAHGTTVIDYAHADERHTPMPIIVITANDHWLEDVVSRGVQNILVKPVSMPEMVDLVIHLTSE